MRTLYIPAAALAVLAAVALHPATPASAATTPVRLAAPVAPNAIDDATIVAIFDWANSADIETGGIAATRGSTKDVRDFGKMLVRDHKSVQQQGRDLAKKLGVKVPTLKNADNPLYAQHVAALKQLRSARKGVDFDRAFLQHEVDFHKAVIDAVTNQFLPAIQNAELKDFVTKVAPAFQAHMLAAQNKLDKLSA